VTYNDSLQQYGAEFIVRHDLRIIYCIVGKVACTSWLRVLLELTGIPAAQSIAEKDQNSVHLNFRPYLKTVGVRKAAELSRSTTEDYYTYMFVRDPLERLVSAYRDKMIRDYSHAGLRRKIISRYRSPMRK